MKRIKTFWIVIAIFYCSIVYGEDIKSIEFHIATDVTEADASKEILENDDVVYIRKEPSIITSDIKIATLRISEPRLNFPGLDAALKKIGNAELIDETLYDVLLELNAEGAMKMADITRSNIGNRMAILINGKVLMAPVIREEIPGGVFAITENKTREEAVSLVEAINSAIGIAGAI